MNILCSTRCYSALTLYNNLPRDVHNFLGAFMHLHGHYLLDLDWKADGKCSLSIHCF